MSKITVKLCGLKTRNDVKCAIENGADFIGLVFFDKSPRNIGFDDARELAILAREFNPQIQICAVTVNPDDELISQINVAIAPDYLQIHALDNFERAKKIKENQKTILAFGICDAKDVGTALYYADACDYLLFDAKPPKNAENMGGFGVSFDWSLLKNLPIDLNWILSGGLNPDNVKTAIAATNARFVDVSSGIESSLGIKDSAKIVSFMNAVKA